MPGEKPEDIRERTLRFTCEVLDYVNTIEPVHGARMVVDQLVRSAGAVGANLEEAQAASTRREFIRCNQLALREARESRYWLEVAGRRHWGDQVLIRNLRREAPQLVAIISTIVIRAKNNSNKGAI